MVSHIRSVVTMLMIARTGATCSGLMESCLIEDLFANYSKEARPRLDHSEAVHLNVSYYMRSLSQINAEDETMETVGFWTVVWYDEVLVWDPDDYEGISDLQLPAQKVWLPDLYLENSVGDFHDSSFKEDFLVTVYDDGSIFWEFGGTFRTRCEINMLHYPYDTQTCALVMGLWMYTHHKVDIRAVKPLKNEDAFDNSLWKFIEFTYSKHFTYDVYAMASFEYKFQRKPLYYIVNILVPVIFLLVVSMGTFWLPSECGEKASLGITVVLASSVFQLIISANTPINSDVTPNINKLVTAILTVSTMALISGMLSIYCCFKTPNNRVPRLIRVIAFNYLAKIFFLQKDIPKEPECCEAHADAVIEEVDRPKSVGKWVKNTELQDILYEMRCLKVVVMEQEKADFVVNEWKCLGKIIDRFLFCICLTAFLITVTSIYA